MPRDGLPATFARARSAKRRSGDYTGGLVRLERGDLAGARRELLDALDGDARPWVRARTHLALGKVLDRTGDHAGARVAYENAARLGELGRDPATTAEARRLRARVP